MANLLSDTVYIHYTDAEGSKILIDKDGMPIEFNFDDFTSGKIEQILSLIATNGEFVYSPLTEQEVTWAIKNDESNLIEIAIANPRS